MSIGSQGAQRQKSGTSGAVHVHARLVCGNSWTALPASELLPLPFDRLVPNLRAFRSRNNILDMDYVTHVGPDSGK